MHIASHTYLHTLSLPNINTYSISHLLAHPLPSKHQHVQHHTLTCTPSPFPTSTHTASHTYLHTLSLPNINTCSITHVLAHPLPSQHQHIQHHTRTCTPSPFPTSTRTASYTYLHTPSLHFSHCLRAAMPITAAHLLTHPIPFHFLPMKLKLIQLPALAS